MAPYYRLRFGILQLFMSLISLLHWLEKIFTNKVVSIKSIEIE